LEKCAGVIEFVKYYPKLTPMNANVAGRNVCGGGFVTMIICYVFAVAAALSFASNCWGQSMESRLQCQSTWLQPQHSLS